MLSGRVFYLPFMIIALVWGRLAAGFRTAILSKMKFHWTYLLLAIGGYCNALFILYDKDDFTRLHIQTETAAPLPASWNPYADNVSLWPIILLVTILVLIIVQLYFRKRKSG